jgi:hypothetical protein
MDNNRFEQLIGRGEAKFQLDAMNDAVRMFEQTPWKYMDRTERLVRLWLIITFQPYEVLYERELLREIRGWFRLSSIAALVAFGLISTGSFAIITGNITVGALTAVSSVLPSAVSTMFFARYKWVSKRADIIYFQIQSGKKDLYQLEEVI